jgi:hypothetical protein
MYSAQGAVLDCTARHSGWPIPEIPPPSIPPPGGASSGPTFGPETASGASCAARASASSGASLRSTTCTRAGPSPAPSMSTPGSAPPRSSACARGATRARPAAPKRRGCGETPCDSNSTRTPCSSGSDQARPARPGVRPVASGTTSHPSPAWLYPAYSGCIPPRNATRTLPVTSTTTSASYRQRSLVGPEGSPAARLGALAHTPPADVVISLEASAQGCHRAVTRSEAKV